MVGGSKGKRGSDKGKCTEGGSKGKRVGNDDLRIVAVTNPTNCVLTIRLTFIAAGLTAAVFSIFGAVVKTWYDRHAGRPGAYVPLWDQDEESVLSLPLPTPELVTDCSLDSVATALGLDACRGHCVWAECCFLPPERAVSCQIPLNKDICQQYQDACGVLDDDTTLH